MKGSQKCGKRIPRTYVPMASATLDSWNKQPPDVSFFFKIKGNVKLLEPSTQPRKKQRSTQSFRKRFSLSKRLQQLSKHHTISDRMNQTARDHFSENKATDRSFNKNATMYNPRPRRFNQDEDLELANLTKTINGTRLGALSSLQIMDQLDAEENQRKGNEIFGYDTLVKRLQSQTAEDLSDIDIEAQNFMTRGIRKLAITRKNTQGNSKQLKNPDKLLDTIYGGEEFLEKCKQYHMLLMQKNSYYKSKKLSLDYKNQWRI